MNRLANTYLRMGKSEEAASYYEKILDLYDQIYGRHPSIKTASTLGKLGLAYENLGKFQEAKVKTNKSLNILKQIYDPLSNHPHVAATLNNLGNICNALGDAKNAI